MEEPKKLKSIAGIIDSWWKIIGVLVAVILFIYNVSSVWIEIQNSKSELEDVRKELKEEKAFRKSSIKGLRDRGIELTIKFQEHLIEDAYFRGKTDANIENLQKVKD